jgi:hypothetical protein
MIRDQSRMFLLRCSVACAGGDVLLLHCDALVRARTQRNGRSFTRGLDYDCVSAAWSLHQTSVRVQWWNITVEYLLRS